MNCRESSKYLLNLSLVAQMLNTCHHEKQQVSSLLLYSCHEIIIGPQQTVCFAQLVAMM